MIPDMGYTLVLDENKPFLAAACVVSQLLVESLGMRHKSKVGQMSHQDKFHGGAE